MSYHTWISADFTSPAAYGQVDSGKWLDIVGMAQQTDTMSLNGDEPVIQTGPASGTTLQFSLECGTTETILGYTDTDANGHFSYKVLVPDVPQGQYRFTWAVSAFDWRPGWGGQAITVRDCTAPSVTNVNEAALQGVPVASGQKSATTTVTGTARDVGSEIKAVDVRIDGGSYQPATVTPTTDHMVTFTSDLDIPLGAHGRVPYTVTVRAVDHAGNSTEASISVFATDATPPSLSILHYVQNGQELSLNKQGVVDVPGGLRPSITPRGVVNVPFHPHPRDLTIRGSAVDHESSVQSVCWCLDDGPDVPATLTSAGWAAWSIDQLKIPQDDAVHVIAIRCTDAYGNRFTQTVKAQVVFLELGHRPSPGEMMHV